ncbi:perilipin-3-like [Sceloporus undulatus]|uniref:perilipin-3-like n=1 Tax=Sceloporus undulatus TaxID=8520 RepID=UPI001C4B3348|nr:perilipin-3-like [Sceloporus undulatus]
MATGPKGDSQEAPKTENIVTRITSLPLISSAYELCSSLYNYAKESIPFVNSACNVAEMVVAVAVGSAMGGAQPILNQLEPQIAAANEYACKRLDKLEETMPCLHQPAHQVIEEGVTLAKSVVGSTVNTAKDAANGAKELVVHKVNAAVDLTKDIIQDSIGLTKSVVDSTVNTAVNAANEAKVLMTHRVTDVINLSKETAKESVGLTKSVVSSTVNTALQAAMGTKDLVTTGQVKNCGALQEGIEMTNVLQQILTSGVDAMLEKTEEMIDYYLPMTDEELVKLATEVRGFGPPSVEEQQRRKSYFVRLGSLSSKVRHRAYLHSLDKLQIMKENTQDRLSQLQLVINLVEQLKQGVGQRFQEAQQKLNQLMAELTQTQPGEVAEGDLPPEVESLTLALLRFVTQDLGSTYVRLVGGIEGLPCGLREKVDQAISNARQLHTSFAAATSIQDLSSSVLAQSHEKIAQAREFLDTLVEYIAQNTPLSWIVGPFRPSSAPTEEPPVTEMETSPSADQEMKEITNEDEQTSSASGGSPKERVTGARRTSAGLKSAKKNESEMEESEAKEAAKTLVGVWSDMPKKARKMIRREASKEVVPEKASKSDLNQVAETPEKEH